MRGEKSYQSSGVHQKKANQLVDWLRGLNAYEKPFSPPPLPPQKKKKGSLTSKKPSPLKRDIHRDIGGFSALFPAPFSKMTSPYLVSSTDGVGTKLKLATYFHRYKEVGQDLVAMCVNDLICSGAQPLFFLDYYSCGHLKLKQAKSFLTGVSKACKVCDCPLVGGETAEMPGLYKKDDFDCAGFALGVVEKKDILGAHKVKMGDALIALSSSGFHSNGFSLLRQVFHSKKDLEKWKNTLLKPTLLYAPLIRNLLPLGALHAIAHITGGGMDNLLRVLPDQCEALLQPWNIPPPFLEVQKRTKMSLKNLLKTFNSGVGMVLVVNPRKKNKLLHEIQKTGFSAFLLGHVTSSQQKKWTLT